ncbi:MAG: type II secretion system protein M [Burkholderiales bacterium]|nr:type II secretion system protein M [Burkholderiales bacterium]MCJ7839293.1 type II secretion system protein M [Burkholderiales bacterium]
MKARLRKLWESRSPRDRTIIAVLAALVGVALYLALVQSAYRGRAKLGTSVSALRTQALRLDADANELARARAAPAAPAPKSDLRTQVQAQADAAGLASALLRIDARDADQVKVAFGSVAFADWLGWVATLQAQHIRLEASRIEALTTPGLVSVTATLARAKSQ